VTVSPSCSATDADACLTLVVVSPLGSAQTRLVSVRGCPGRPPLSRSWYVPACNATVCSVAARPSLNEVPAPVYLQPAPGGAGSVTRRTTSVPVCCPAAGAPTASTPATAATAIQASTRTSNGYPRRAEPSATLGAGGGRCCSLSVPSTDGARGDL